MIWKLKRISKYYYQENNYAFVPAQYKNLTHTFAGPIKQAGLL